eukprot:gene22338-28458_t
MIPHVYATSASAYKGLRDHNRNQSILVSGESGAGKTETVKILMGHLAQVSGKENDTTIVKVLKANPLLESFGNAKTVRNDNSSRFGKFTQLQFDQDSKLVGSRCVTYLLEKTRVVSQSDEHERNYHIFHELFAAPESVKEELFISSLSCRDFMYTCQGDTRTDTIEGVTDGARFLTTMTTLGLIGVTGALQQQIREIIVGIVYLGQICFSGDADTSQIDSSVSEETIERCCSLLGLDTMSFKERMIVRNIDAAGDTLLVALSREQAIDGRDALAKDTYTRLFLWLVSIINESTAASEVDTERNRIIGLLDIFGFESFRVNRFEQLCINYTNEKLQQKFTLDVLMTVQAEYREEGLDWETIDYKDNNDVLDLLESRLGFIALLNEECLLPKGSNANFLNKITHAYNKNPLFSLSVHISRDEFCIQHYAGKVSYNVTGFIERNKDALPSEMRTLMLTSNNELIAHIFAPLHAGADNLETLAPRRRPSDGSSAHSNPINETVTTHTRKASTGNIHGSAGAAPVNRRQSFMKADTVFTKFKSQLTSLMESISYTDVNYVRCIKPNSNKDRTEYNRLMVVEQLRCAGIIEAVKVSRAAYPYRISHHEFMSRFRCLKPSSWWKVSELDESSLNDGHLQTKSLRKQHCQQLLTAFSDAFQSLPAKKASGATAKSIKKLFELGKGKVFFSDGVLEVLERERGAVLGSRASRIQRKVRSARQRHRFLYVRACTVYIQAFYRCHSIRHQFLEFLASVRCVQCNVRKLLAMQLLKRMRRDHRATKIQTQYRRHRRQSRYRNARRGCTVLSSIVRMVLQRIKFVKMRDEARESAKLSNQLEQLKQRLVFEQQQRSHLEAAMLLQQQESAAIMAAQLLNQQNGANSHDANARSEQETQLAIENDSLRKQLAILLAASATADTDTVSGLTVQTSTPFDPSVLAFSRANSLAPGLLEGLPPGSPTKMSFVEQQAVSSAELAALEHLQSELVKHRTANELLESETQELRRELKKAYNYLDIKSGEVAYAKVMLEVAERERDVFRIDKDKNSRLVMQYRAEKQQLMETMIAQSAEMESVRQQLQDASARCSIEALRRDTIKVGLVALMNSSSASFYSSDHVSQEALLSEIHSVFDQEEELFQASHATDSEDQLAANITSNMGNTGGGGISRIMSKNTAASTRGAVRTSDLDHSGGQNFTPPHHGVSRAKSHSVDEESVYSVHSNSNLNLNINLSSVVAGSGGTVSSLPRRRRRQGGGVGGGSSSSANLRGSPSGGDHDSVISSISTHRTPREKTTPRGGERHSASGSAHSNGERRDVFEAHTNSIKAASSTALLSSSNRSGSRRQSSSRNEDLSPRHPSDQRRESSRHSSSSNHHLQLHHSQQDDPSNSSAEIDFDDIYPSLSRVNTAAGEDLKPSYSSNRRPSNKDGGGTLRDALGREIVTPPTKSRHSRSSSKASNHSSSSHAEPAHQKEERRGHVHTLSETSIEQHVPSMGASGQQEVAPSPKGSLTGGSGSSRSLRVKGSGGTAENVSPKTDKPTHFRTTPDKSNSQVELHRNAVSLTVDAPVQKQQGVLVDDRSEVDVSVAATEESAAVNIFSSNFWTNLF